MKTGQRCLRIDDALIGGKGGGIWRPSDRLHATNNIETVQEPKYVEIRQSTENQLMNKSRETIERPGGCWVQLEFYLLTPLLQWHSFASWELERRVDYSVKCRQSKIVQVNGWKPNRRLDNRRLAIEMIWDCRLLFVSADLVGLLRWWLAAMGRTCVRSRR